MNVKTQKRIKSFLEAGDTNREFETYLAYRERIKWPYSIPLESVVLYLKLRNQELNNQIDSL